MTSPIDLHEKLKEFKHEKKFKIKAILKLLSDYERSTIVIIFATDKVVSSTFIFFV